MERIEKQLKGYTKDLPIERISQGAEAVVYKTQIHPYIEDYNGEIIIKYRPPKPYRHPILDAQLIKHQTLSECRILQKLSNKNVNAPKLIFTEPMKGLVWMECISGKSLKQYIWDSEHVNGPEEIKSALTKAGEEIGKLHMLDIVHGDLTTSNLVLKEDEPYLIDFGLGSHSGLPEDKAVDLYVLERAVLSTHPVHSEKYNAWLLAGYLRQNEEGGKTSKTRVKEVMKRLEDVRMRGRKRSMVG